MSTGIVATNFVNCVKTIKQQKGAAGKQLKTSQTQTSMKCAPTPDSATKSCRGLDQRHVFTATRTTKTMKAKLNRN